MNLNQQAAALAQEMVAQASRLRIASHCVDGGGRVIDCGVNVAGGLAAGCSLARLTAGDLLSVRVTAGDVAGVPNPWVEVSTDHPLVACMAAQYAGWQLSRPDFFAMGSGPFRCLSRVEKLFNELGYEETAEVAVGALETSTLPGAEVFELVSQKTGIRRENVILAVAPTSSLAGCLQVVARSVETALHKLHELEFDLTRIVSGFGCAPLPPPGKKDIDSLGRTNDAVLYGARVVLWVKSEDAVLAEMGPKVPSSASSDYGAPFEEIFARYDHDFYKIDRKLFSPAEVVFYNLPTGRAYSFGGVNHDVLRRSFF